MEDRLVTLEQRLEALAKSVEQIGKSVDGLVQLAQTLTQGDQTAAQIAPGPMSPTGVMPQQQEQLTPEEIKKIMLEDPVKALEVVTEQKLKPLVPILSQTMLSSLRAEALRKRLESQAKYPDWKEYEDLISKMEEAIDPRALVQPHAYDALYAVAKGLKASELVEKAKRGEVTIGPTFTEKEGRIPQEPEPPEQEELTDVEKKIAKQFGMSEDEYILFKAPDLESLSSYFQKSKTPEAKQ